MSAIRPFDPGGRRVWVPQNNAHRMAAVLSTATLTPDEIVREHLGRWRGNKKRHHTGALHVDQGREGACTAAASLHLVAAGPVRPSRAGVRALPHFLSLYEEIRAEDRAMGYHFPEGCTSLAMARVWKKRGWCGAYRWGRTFSELLAGALLEPVAIGVNWYTSMFYPDSRGRIKIGGQVEGGHELVVVAVDLDDRLLTLHQSWGRDHGRRGYVDISWDDAERLVEENGDVLLTRELRAA